MCKNSRISCKGHIRYEDGENKYQFKVHLRESAGLQIEGNRCCLGTFLALRGALNDDNKNSFLWGIFFVTKVSMIDSRLAEMAGKVSLH